MATPWAIPDFDPDRRARAKWLTPTCPIGAATTELKPEGLAEDAIRQGSECACPWAWRIFVSFRFSQGVSPKELLATQTHRTVETVLS